MLITFVVYLVGGTGVLLLKQHGYVTCKASHLLDAMLPLVAAGLCTFFIEEGYVVLLPALMWSALDVREHFKCKHDDDDPKNKRKRLVSKLKSHIPRPTIVAVRPIQQGA